MLLFRYLVLGLCLGTSSLLAVQGTLASFEVGDEVSTITSPRVVLLESSPTELKHGLRIHTRFTGFVNGNYSIGYQLLNESGNVINISGLQDSNGDTVVIVDRGVKNFVFGPTLTVSFGTGEFEDTVFLLTSSDLPVSNYRVKLALYEVASIPNKYLTGAESSLFELQVFEQVSDANKNIKLRVDSLELKRPFIIDQLSGYEAFPLSLDLRALRYDIDNSPSKATAKLNLTVNFKGSDGVKQSGKISLDNTTFNTGVTLSLSNLLAKSTDLLPSSLSYTDDLYLIPPVGILPSTAPVEIELQINHNDSNTGEKIVLAPAFALSESLYRSDGFIESGALRVAISGIDSYGALNENNQQLDVALVGITGLHEATGHTFNGNATLRIESDTKTRLSAGQSLTLTPAKSPDTVEINGVLMERGTARLTESGPVLDSGSVKLPSGLGWTTLTDDYYAQSNVGESWLEIVPDSGTGTITLNDQLTPNAQTLGLRAPISTYPSAVKLMLNEESKPFVWMAESVDWSPGDGSFSWDALDVIASHDDEWTTLEEFANTMNQSHWRQKRDNRAYLRKPAIPDPSDVIGALPAGRVHAETGESGDAQLNTEIAIDCPNAGANPYPLYPHLPAGSTIIWDNSSYQAQGYLQINRDLLSGSLQSVTSIDAKYYPNSIGDDCSSSGYETIQTLLPNDSQQLEITQDGGLRSPALNFSVSSASTDLLIGTTINNSGQDSAVHTVSGWPDGSTDFLMAGISLAGTSNWRASSTRDDFAVSTLLNTGYFQTEGGEWSEARPGTSEYMSGLGSYPGLNFKISEGDPVEGHSQLGESRIPATGAYPLKQTSKYYVRLGGVNGIHDVDFSSQRSVFQVYGYDLEFYRFGLAYINNLNAEYSLDSTVAADLSFSTPPLSGFELAFDQMSVTGNGNLESGDLILDSTNPKEPLAYWQGAAIPRSFSFNQDSTAPCDKSRLLVLGVETYAAPINSPLYGYLAIASHSTPANYTNGSLVSLADASKFENTRPRVYLPSRVYMRGPATTVDGNTSYEYYSLRPVSDAYFNNFDETGGPTSGFLAFGATMDVSFFENLKVHVRSSSADSADQDTSESSTFYLSGGWEDGSATFWNHDAGFDFDASHKGWDGASFEDYWTKNHKQPDYDIRANQSVFGLFDLSYPVEWNPSLRHFKGNKQSVDLIVINANHKLDYLSADRANITFGVKAGMEGIPDINLGTIAMNASGAANGILASLSQAASAQIGLILDQGANAIDDLLADVPEVLFKSTWDSLVSPFFQDQVIVAADAVGFTSDLVTQLETTLDVSRLQRYFDPELDDWFFNKFKNSIAVTTESQSVVRQIDAKLAQMQNGLRSISSYSVEGLSTQGIWLEKFSVVNEEGNTVELDWIELANRAKSNE